MGRLRLFAAGLVSLAAPASGASAAPSVVFGHVVVGQSVDRSGHILIKERFVYRAPYDDPGFRAYLFVASAAGRPVPGTTKVVHLTFPASDQVRHFVITLRLSVAQVAALRRSRQRFTVEAGYEDRDQYGHVVSNEPAAEVELTIPQETRAGRGVRSEVDVARPVQTAGMQVEGAGLDGSSPAESPGTSTLRVDPLGIGAVLRASSTVSCPAGQGVVINRLTYEVRMSRSWGRYRPPGATGFTTPSRALSVVYASATVLEEYGYTGRLRLVSHAACGGTLVAPSVRVYPLVELEPTDHDQSVTSASLRPVPRPPTSGEIA